MALSIPGPWWWFVLNVPPPWRKDVQSHRQTPCVFRGWCLVHAPAELDEKHFRSACAFARERGVSYLPDFKTLHRGGIVGLVKVIGHVEQHASRWFTGKPVLVLEDPLPTPFRPCRDGVGFFEPEYDAHWRPQGKAWIDKPAEGCFGKEGAGGGH